MDANSKEKSHNVAFAKGGTTPMLGGHGPVGGKELAAGDQQPGTSHHDNDGGAGEKHACGGKTKMFSFAPSMVAKGGITGAR